MSVLGKGGRSLVMKPKIARQMILDVAVLVLASSFPSLSSNERDSVVALQVVSGSLSTLRWVVEMKREIEIGWEQAMVL